MSTQKVGNVDEVDVAKVALLQVQNESQRSPRQRTSKKKILRIQQKLLTNMFSNLEPMTSTPSCPSRSSMTNRKTVVRSNSLERDSLHESFQKEQSRWSGDHISKVCNKTMKTKDTATQTEDEYKPQTPLEKMEAVLKILCAKLETFETQTSSSEKSPNAEGRQQKYSLTDDVIDLTASPDSTEEYIRSAENNSCSVTIPLEDIKRERSFDTNEDEEKPFGVKMAETSPTVIPSTSKAILKMEKIGKSKTTVPSGVLWRIDWSNYRTATRKLLKAVFSRKILATHSLSGKPGPTSGRPAKKALDENLVDDVIQTLVERCNVSASDVRKIITQTCNDEAKAYRFHQWNEKRKRLSEDTGAEESTSSSSEKELL